MWHRVLVALAICAVILVGGRGKAGATSGWVIVPGVNPGAVNVLYGVAAPSANDAWAVGNYEVSPGSPAQSLIENWNGTAWLQTPAAPEGIGSRLQAVSAISPTDIWAVGDYAPNAKSDLTLTEHWNGTQWSVIPSPNVGHQSTLDSVSAISPNDVWAVGYTDGGYGAISIHWDGTRWSIVPLAIPPGATSGTLHGVASVGTHDVWAVGYWLDANGPHGLSEHWNGSAWTYVPPNTLFGSPLNAVTHLSGSNMLAIGPGQTDYSYLWSGKAWVPGQGVPLPAGGLLSAVTSSHVASAWSVGYTVNNNIFLTLTVHAAQGVSAVVPSPNTNWPNNYLLGVSMIPGTQDVWAVGGSDDNASGNVLIEYYSP